MSWGNVEVEEVHDETTESTSTTEAPDGTPRFEPGTRADCPDCGKNLSVTATGALRSHVCTTDVNTRKSPAKSGKRRKAVPKSVMELGVPAIAGAVEWGNEFALGRILPGVEVPDEIITIPDPEDMVGPLLTLLWPTLPAGAQKAIEAIADESDLIVCALAWMDYYRNLTQWTRAQQRRVTREKREAANVTVHGQDEGSPSQFGDIPGFFESQSV